MDAQRQAIVRFMAGKDELAGEFVEVESGRKDHRAAATSDPGGMPPVARHAGNRQTRPPSLLARVLPAPPNRHCLLM